MRAVSNRLIILPLKEEDKNENGLFIVSTNKTLVKGVVIHAGEACKSIKNNDTVIYHRDTGMTYNEYRIISEMDVVVFFKGDKNE